MFKPTLEYIREYMKSKYNGYEIATCPKENLINWMFVVYIPNDCEITMGKEVQDILGFFMEVQEETYGDDIDEEYNIIEEFNSMKTAKYYVFYESEQYTYDWFVFLAICIENNFIVDTIEISSGEPTIYNIEPAASRLKVRL